MKKLILYKIRPYIVLNLNLINLWKISLHNNDNMFPLPKSLKNPFTNIKFDSYQLYNIYFKYGFSINIIPEIIIDFFKVTLI